MNIRVDINIYDTVGVILTAQGADALSRGYFAELTRRTYQPGDTVRAALYDLLRGLESGGYRWDSDGPPPFHLNTIRGACQVNPL